MYCWSKTILLAYSNRRLPLNTYLSVCSFFFSVDFYATKQIFVLDFCVCNVQTNKINKCGAALWPRILCQYGSSINRWQIDFHILCHWFHSVVFPKTEFYSIYIWFVNWNAVHIYLAPSPSYPQTDAIKFN